MSQHAAKNRILSTLPLPLHHTDKYVHRGDAVPRREGNADGGLPGSIFCSLDEESCACESTLKASALLPMISSPAKGDAICHEPTPGHVVQTGGTIASDPQPVGATPREVTLKRWVSKLECLGVLSQLATKRVETQHGDRPLQFAPLDVF